MKAMLLSEYKKLDLVDVEPPEIQSTRSADHRCRPAASAAATFTDSTAVVAAEFRP